MACIFDCNTQLDLRYLPCNSLACMSCIRKNYENNAIACPNCRFSHKVLDIDQLRCHFDLNVLESLEDDQEDKRFYNSFKCKRINIIKVNMFAHIFLPIV